MSFRESEKNLIDALEASESNEDQNELIDTVVKIKQEEIDDFHKQLAEISNSNIKDVVKKAATEYINDEITYIQQFINKLNSLKASTGGKKYARKSRQKRKTRKNKKTRRHLRR